MYLIANCPNGAATRAIHAARRIFSERAFSRIEKIHRERCQEKYQYCDNDEPRFFHGDIITNNVASGHYYLK